MKLEELKKPFPANKIQWRVGATNNNNTRGLALAYIDARAIMNRLDEVVGPENWQKEYFLGENEEIVCNLGIRINGEWVWKSDGAGKTDFEAIKGGMSDSFKRAAVCWGIGRYLYDLPTKWVNIEKKGGRYVIEKEPKLPPKFLPENAVQRIRNIYQNNPKRVKETIKKFLEEVGLGSNLSNVSQLTNVQAKELLKN